MENIEIPPFYIGQEVVATDDFPDAKIKKGDEFIIRSITKPCHWVVDIGIKATSHSSICKCGNIWKNNGVWWITTKLLAPKYKLGEFVSMKEVVQLETVCAN